MLRKLTSLVLTSICIAAIGLFVNQTAIAQPTVVTVGGEGGFKLPSKNDTAPQQRANRAIVEAFEREHPDIKLESAQGLEIGGPAAESGLLMQFAGGSAPDVIYVNFRTSATYINQGFLRPLDDFVSKDPSVISSLNPRIQQVLKDVGHGHIYSVPYSQFVQALYYRKDMFQEAGLDPDKPPQTWDEFYYDAQKLTDQKKGVWGFEFGNGPGDTAYWWVNFLWQAGGEVVTRNASGQWVAAFNSPAGVSALNFYRKLMKGRWKGPDGEINVGVATHSSNMAQDRAAGKVGMWFQYQSNVLANTTDATVLNPSLIGIAPMPRGPTGITANEINAAMWGISSQIKDTKTVLASWEFVKFMASDEADRIRTKAFVEAGLGSSVNPASLEKYGYADDVSAISKTWLAANKFLFAHGKPEPYGENMNEIYILLGDPLSSAESNPDASSSSLLDVTAREVNTKLTGYVAPAVMRERRTWAWIIFSVVSAFSIAAGLRALRGIKQMIRPNSSQLPGRGKSVAVAILFLLPAVSLVAIWKYYPLLRGLQLAFQNYRIIGVSTYIGLDNFIDVFHQPSFWYGLRNSCIYSAYSIGMGFVLPILLAIGLSEIPKGKVLFRTLYYLPAATAPAVIALIWKWLEDGSPNGLFNTAISAVSQGHAKPIDWLNDPHWAMFSVVLPSIWAAAGPGSIIYLAAMQSIPDEMYEAAELDGAGIWAKIWRVTLPTLKPLILINLVGTTIGTFQAMENIFIMTGGGPSPYVTHTLGLEVFYNAFLFLKFGYATAVAWIMGTLLIGFTIWQLRIMKDLRYSTAKG